MFTIPSVSDFKSFFVRDFSYGSDQAHVMDQDITTGLLKAGINMNQALFPDQSTFTVGYLYASAHYMVLDIRASSQGVSGKFSFLQTAKGAGSVNEAFAIPQRILDNPYWAQFYETRYGAEYLNMLMPSLIGAAFSVCGDTRP